MTGVQTCAVPIWRFTPLKSFIGRLFLGFHQALACEIELVIAMDVSRSVDQYEFDLMRSGTANAFRPRGASCLNHSATD